MKRIFAITLMFAVCTLLSQCRKPEIPVNEDVKPQSITFSTGVNGEKGHLFFEEDKLKYQWETDDKIYVYSSTEESQPNFSTGHYCGELSLKSGSGSASGTFYVESMDIPTNTKYLRFIHFRSDGGVVVSTTSDGVSAICDLSQQNGLLTGDGSVSTKLIAYCDEPYNPNGVYQNCKLKTPFAILNLDLSLFSNKVYMSCILENGVNVAASGQIMGVSGIYTDLNDLNTDVSNTDDNKNYYIAVMPLGYDANLPIKFADHPNGYNPGGTNLIKTASLNIPGGIEAGKYYQGSSSKDSDGNDDSSIKFRGITSLPKEALPGVFTVGVRQSVHFAKGNLWCNSSGSTTSSWSWNFETNQWDYAKTFENRSHVSHFFWSVGEGYYGASNNYNNDVESTTATIDWGPKISNKWFTLSNTQWAFLLHSRISNLNKKFASLNSGSNKGLILLPDNQDSDNLNSISNTGDLELYNAVFLPAAGYRPSGNYPQTINDIEVSCRYWTCNRAPKDGSIYKAYNLLATSSSISDPSTSNSDRSKGYSVRLVCN